MLRILVQKFGGTSVADEKGREQVVKKVRDAVDGGYRVVVVVSAMGRSGAPYATDTLIEMAHQISPAINPRELDLLMSCGETISTVIIASALQASGIDSAGFTGQHAGIVTDANYNNARIKEIHPEHLRKTLDLGKVAVVAGFQGVTEEGDITTLGRGGSDTTAVALGVALHAEVVEIFTDVEGIMTADPRLVPGAKPLETMTYTEVCEMAHLGAKVIHPRAVEIGMEGRVPIRIRSTFSDLPGTLITDGQYSGTVEIQGDHVVTGLAHIGDVAQIKLTSDEDLNQNGKALEIFQSLATAEISVDMIQVSPHRIACIVQENYIDRVQKVLNPMGLNLAIIPGLAKVSVVGAGMRGIPGVMARVVQALNRQKIALLQTTDSHTNISCLVLREDMSKALQALHDEFLPVD